MKVVLCLEIWFSSLYQAVGCHILQRTVGEQRLEAERLSDISLS